jgi:hypothetical protein
MFGPDCLSRAPARAELADPTAFRKPAAATVPDFKKSRLRIFLILQHVTPLVSEVTKPHHL